MCLGGRLHGRPCIGCPPLATTRPQPVKQEPIIVPLTGAFATVNIVDYTAEVTLKQRYENKEKDPIEAVYEFPLDPKASVSQFYAEIDGRKIVGSVKEKEKAKDIYDDAISSGHGAYLLEESVEKPSQFTASVGNLPPGKEVLLVIVYVTELEFEDGKLKFVLPTHPFPPDGKRVLTFEPPSQKGYEDQVPFGLRVEVNFNMTSNIKSISSPSHPISFEFGDTPQSALVKLANTDSVQHPLTTDFQLHVSLAQPHSTCGRVQLDQKGQKKICMLSLYPKLDDDMQVFTEMLFVVDRSGSMSGSRINQVRDTLQIFLRSLPEGTLFNIVGFGSKHELLFKEGSQEYNEKTLTIATEHVKKMTANLGGTNILSPLQAILSEKPKEGIPRQLFLLTDGEVSNTQECVDYVRKHSDTTRVFTFGIGTDASKDLVLGMAKAGEGKAEIIKMGDNMDEKVLRQLDRALKPALADLKVEWGELSNQVSQTPYHLPPLFAGGRLLVYGYVPNTVNSTATVTVKASIGSQPFAAQVAVNFENTEKGDHIVKLAAKSMIRDLEEGRSYMHDPSGNLRPGNSQDKLKAEIIDLSVRTGIISKHTAFVAVEKRDEAVEGDMKLRKIGMEEIAQQASPRNSSAYGALPTVQGPSSPRGNSLGGGGGRGGVVRARAASPQNHGFRGGASPDRRDAADGASLESLHSQSTQFKSASKKKSSSSSSGLMSKLGSVFGGSGSSSGEKQKERKKMDAPAASRAPRSLESSSVSSSSSSAPPAAPPPAPSYALADAMLARRSDSISSDSDGDEAEEWEEDAKPVEKERDTKKGAVSTSKNNNNNNNSLTKLAAPQQQPQPQPQASSSAKPASDVGALRELITKQKANGSFSFDVLKGVISGASPDQLRKGSPLESNNTDDALVLLVTAVLCSYFEVRYADQKVNWNLVVKKARTWIKKEASKLGVADDFDWDAFGKQFLASHGVKQ